MTDDTPGASWTPSDAAPREVGAYRIVRPLAAGGFGAVHLAERIEGGAPAAVKIMHADLAGSPEAVARFERELAVLRRFRHPGVVEVHDGGRLPDGRPWFAMELLAGVSLKEHLAARGPLPPREALDILEPLCAAVAAAHALAIVHRDIKPSNVFLAAARTPGDERGADPGAGEGRPRPRVVLLDFGVAKLLDAEGPGLTSSRHVLGTVACMAPEQILGKPVDERADVYALGALAYRMLTGEPPFSAKSPLAVQQMHLYAAPRPPSRLVALDPALDEPILRALGKEPDARQPGALAFIAELTAACGPARAGEARRALAVLAEVHADPDALAAPDERLLDDLDAVLPAAVEALEAAGLRLSLETSTSALLSAARPDDAGEDARLRRRLLEDLRALARRLDARAGRDPRVRVRLCLHAASAALTPDGAITAGDLLQLAARVPDLAAGGVLASAPALEGLDLPARPAGEAGGVAWREIAAA